MIKGNWKRSEALDEQEAGHKATEERGQSEPHIAGGRIVDVHSRHGQQGSAACHRGGGRAGLKHDALSVHEDLSSTTKTLLDDAFNLQFVLLATVLALIGDIAEDHRGAHERRMDRRRDIRRAWRAGRNDQTDGRDRLDSGRDSDGRRQQDRGVSGTGVDENAALAFVDPRVLCDRLAAGLGRTALVRTAGTVVMGGTGTMSGP